jgi:hypothetical protein
MSQTSIALVWNLCLSCTTDDWLDIGLNNDVSSYSVKDINKWYLFLELCQSLLVCAMNIPCSLGNR